MRILLVHNKYKLPGGEDNVFNEESELLQRHGHEVEQVLFDNSVIRTFFDKCISALRVFYNPHSARIIAGKIESFKPDVIHVHNFIPLISPSIFYVANRHRVPIILTLHNFRLICPSATLFHNRAVYEKSLNSYFPFDAVCRGVYRNSIIETAILALTVAVHQILGTWRSKVDYYIALTSFARGKFVSAKVPLPAEKVLVKPNSVPDCGMGTARRRDHFLFVGRLVEEKGLRTLLQATWKSPFSLIIIGDGPMRDEVIEHCKMHPHVVYLGPQNKATVISHMKACAALLFPSMWYEGLPLTLIEAFSAGTPVIASRLGAMQELIQHGVNGLLFESGKEHELIQCIEDIQHERIDVDTMSENARATYLRYFTPERNYNLLVTIYNRAIAMKHALPGNWDNKLIHEMNGVTS